MQRRTFVASIAAFGAARILLPREAFAQGVPNSIGIDKPKLIAPPGACDCHHHIYDRERFPDGPFGGPYQPNSKVADYRKLQARIGTTRNVVVTPGPYIENNGVTTDAIAQLGPNARGVIQLRPGVGDAELKSYVGKGIAGFRFQLAPPTGTYRLDDVEPMAKRIADFGWHAQFYIPGDMIVEAEALLNRMPVTMVFDHMGHFPQPAGIDHPGFKVLQRLIDKGKTWVKLSGAYIDSKSGPPYADTSKVAQALAKFAPQRMVWGSDWPHPGLPANNKPDDALLFDLLTQWVPDEAGRHRVLVENPAELYGFPKAG